MDGRTTQRDIARAAQVDVSTVSLALRAHPRIPETTRKRIQKLADRLGYRPDPALSSIAACRWQRKRNVKGIMLAFLGDNPGSAEAELKLYHRGILKQAESLGYGLESFSLHDFPLAQTFWRVVRARGMRGVVIGQSRIPLPPDFFESATAPVVHCGFLRDIACDMVRPDLRHAVDEMLERITWQYRKVLCFLPVERALHSDRLILGAALAAAATRPRGQISTLLTPEEPRASDWKAFARLKPDAVIVINEKQARRLKTQLGPAGRLPVFTLHTLPPFAGKRGMDLRMEETGQVAVNFLEMKMRRLPLTTASFSQTVLIEPRWLEC